MFCTWQHPSFGTGTGRVPNDIGLLKLTEPADTSSPYIGIIELAEKNYESYTGVITGWGATVGGKLSCILVPTPLYNVHGARK